MSSPEKVEGRCNATTRDDGYCMSYPATTDDGEVRNGRCYKHGGAKGTGSISKGEQRALKHGLYTDRSNYYKNLAPEEQGWVDVVVESFMKDAPFDEENVGKVEIVRQIAIDLHKVRSVNEYIQDNGLTQLQTIGADGQGGNIEQEVENILNTSLDRLERSTVKRLKDLGCLEDPDSQNAQATQTLAEVLSGNEPEDDED